MWELWGEDTVSDNDTSGKAARSEKMVRYSNEAVTRQPPAGFQCSKERGNGMDAKKLLRYTMQLAMLKQLRGKHLINESEYLLIQKRLMKDYGIVSNITA